MIPQPGNYDAYEQATLWRISGKKREEEQPINMSVYFILV